MMSAMTTQVTSLSPAPMQGNRPEPVKVPRRTPDVPAASGPQSSPVTGTGVAADAARQDGGQPASAEEMQSAVSKLNDHIQIVRRNLQFSIDEESGRTVVKVMDAETEEVIRQVPSEEALKLAKHLEEIKGLLFKAKA